MDFVKVRFHLEQDEDGYPPVASETLWAQEAGEGLYLLDNIPFFAAQATVGDLVEARASDGGLAYVATRKPSGNSLIRVIVFEMPNPHAVKTRDGLRTTLKAMGCDSELSHLDSLFAVNVPAKVDLEFVRHVLDQGRDGRWDYEEALVRHGV